MDHEDVNYEDVNHEDVKLLLAMAGPNPERVDLSKVDLSNDETGEETSNLLEDSSSSSEDNRFDAPSRLEDLNILGLAAIWKKDNRFDDSEILEAVNVFQEIWANKKKTREKNKAVEPSFDNQKYSQAAIALCSLGVNSQKNSQESRRHSSKKECNTLKRRKLG